MTLQTVLLFGGIGLATAFFWLALRRIRQREVREIERFEALPPTSDDVFLGDLGIPSDSSLAGKALIVREALAELAEVSPQTLSASVHIFPDMARLPFFDSPDMLGVLLTIEAKTGLAIRGEFQEDIRRAVAEGTLRDVVNVVVDQLRENEDARDA